MPQNTKNPSSFGFFGVFFSFLFCKLCLFICFVCLFACYFFLFRLRELTTTRIGQLCAFSGTVTRTTEVRPELIYGTFQCENCGLTVRNIKQQFKYSEPKRCPNQDCQQNKSWRLLVKKSQFVDWQKVRSQEISEDIPPGSMPRSIDVILRGDIVERAKPGENITFTGTLIVVPNVGSYYSKGSASNARIVNGRTSNSGGAAGGGASNNGVTGLRALGVRELSYKMVFLANNVRLTDKHEEELISGVDSEDREIEKMSIINKIKNTSDAYQQLSHSIAPKIYGHDNIKKGILLMLFGGVKKHTRDGVKLRGDINVCIIGDPSTAKSQFLKYVTRILPRTVYTSGKASTAAGLTAAVMRDAETGEFGIEAGALMLADKGVCCIDEFDKMDELDQAAIHEAMEQQTITITKAGIQATLNARASILAAANPINGRYDKSRPLRHNVSISAPIMSRFDLFFVIVDECDEQSDMRVAQHIVSLHQGKEIDTSFRSELSSSRAAGGSNSNSNDINGNNTHSQDDIRVYINEARKIQPKITELAHAELVKWYRGLRQKDQTDEKAYRITVRQLESLIRLSEALARVYFDEFVRRKYVREAGRLLQTSIISVEEAEIALFDDQDEEGENEQEDGQENEMEGIIDTQQQSGADQDTEMEESEAGNKNTNNRSKRKRKRKAQGQGTRSGSSERAQQQMTFSEYTRLTHMMVYIIRHSESSVNGGITQARLESEVWKEQSDRIDSNDIEDYQNKISMVIKRLIDIDKILLVLKRDGSNSKENVLIVHPNYDPESRTSGNERERRHAEQEIQSQQETDDDNDDENGNDNDTAVTTEANL